MKRQVFHIATEYGDVLYDPLGSTVTNLATSERKRIKKSPRAKAWERPADGLGFEPGVFRPVCLTVYISNHCNLACDYCYTRYEKKEPAILVDPAAVCAAAEWVATSCAREGVPFVLGFHGGNEPLLDPELVDECLRVCRRVARKHELQFLPVCTTNAVISERVAQWAARVFHDVRVSWDGPPDVHDKLRHFPDGAGTSESVERTVGLLRQGGGRLPQLTVRATVTGYSVNRLLDMCEYVGRFGVDRVEVHHVFSNGDNTLPAGLPVRADDFVKNFLVTKKSAAARGMVLSFTGSRLFDFHHRHCPVLQNNVTLTPDGYLTVCFEAWHNNRGVNDKYVYGRYDPHSGRMIIYEERLESLRKRLMVSFTKCEDCENQWHCARSCPTHCPLRDDYDSNITPNCEIERWLSLAGVLDAAGIDVCDAAIIDCRAFFSKIRVSVMNSTQAGHPGYN